MNFIRGSKITEIEIADDFYEAYKRCFESKNQITDEYSHECSSIVAIPGFVNGLFACELYFKILLKDKIKCMHTHNLKELFEELDSKSKEYLQSINNDSSYTLEDLLNQIGDGFKMWRYIFENESNSFGSGRPFEYSQIFLNKYLHLLKQMAVDKCE